MMTMESLRELRLEIMAQGYDEKTAARYAALIGDLPLKDSAGNIIVQDRDGQDLVKLKPLKMFLT